jgi:aminopeptidase N
LIKRPHPTIALAMLDIQSSAASATPSSGSPDHSNATKAIHREDYQAPDFLIPDVHLSFQLDGDATLVTARLTVERSGTHARPLVLDGDELSLVSLHLNGEAQTPTLSETSLTIEACPDRFTLDIVTRINPAANTKLMGLYVSSGNFCTQCEAEGFRRITYFPDRPDVLSRYTVRLEGDQALYPVLLSNGDCTGSGTLEGGRHWAEWSDPFPKPCYLFALVAGNLQANRDQFTTMSGKIVDLAIWVAAQDVPKTAYAMQALKDSMAWDERVYGREYDLSQFNIVAVSDFNFGAMENKSLNIFNARYVLADPETATDFDYDGVAAVVAHEYFHNWSGNRVTCRDWFQLSLKEGFTVFRDQCFSADHGSAAVKRIEDVRVLRASQFQEDAGPLAHPIRPETYLEISNFYTATIYNKGAEIIRMMHTLAGAEAFRKGSDLYFDRHDGTAATCEDFVRAVEDGAGLDLTQFRLWYSQAGTPKVTAALSYEEGETILRLSQHVPPTPDRADKQPMAIPLKLALFDRSTAAHSGETLHILTQEQDELRFPGFSSLPILSVNRGFSAPITLDAARSADDLAFLSAHDDDPFGRYEAMQQLMLGVLVEQAARGQADHDPVIAAVRNTLNDTALEPALIAEALLLPSEAFVGDQMLVVDPDAIHGARESLRQSLAIALMGDWHKSYQAHSGKAFEVSPAAKGSRRLRNVALGYIMAAGAQEGGALAQAQFAASDNMTDRQGALQALVNSDAPERNEALSAFYTRFSGDALVLDKWFSVQAMANHSDTPEAIDRLRGHADFTLSNPNRVRALYGSFGANQWAFHRSDGMGYDLLADLIIELDPVNAQTAAKLVTPLGRWTRFDENRQGLMKAALSRILETPSLSKDVFEQVSKSLG